MQNHPRILTVSQVKTLQLLLEAVAKGELSPTLALDKLKHLDFEPVGDFAKIDHHRQLRTGFPEVIWGPGKTPEQIAQIISRMRQRNPVVMATRIETSVYEQLKELLPDLQYFPIPKLCALITSEELPKQPGIVSIISAGTADLAVAEEAALTAEFSGFEVKRLWDVGVAGIHRLLSNRHVIHEAQVLIVVAGMEGALPSVVAGMADCPVIAVPTSVGYGASFGGIAPLLTMLNSCAAGVGVVNIDNGFGAAILAGQILRTQRKFQPAPVSSTAWQLIYAHDAKGEQITGEINSLIHAIRQGCQVRLVIKFAEEYEYVMEAQSLWIKNETVYAQNTNQVGVRFQRNQLLFPDEASHYMINVSTQGNFDVSRWLVGKHKSLGDVSHKVAIDWFVK